MIDSEILRLAKEYLTSNCTVSEVAEKNGITKKTLQNNFKKLKDIDSSVYQAVENKKADNQIKGRVKGGSVGAGGKKPTYTKEEVNKVADKFISGQLTFKEGEVVAKRPSSTLHDMLHSDLVDTDKRRKLDNVANANKRFMSTEELEERKKRNGK